jgi:hypothetical protein
LPELYVRRRMKEFPWDAAAGREALRSALKEQGASQPIEGSRVGSPERESPGGLPPQWVSFPLSSPGGETILVHFHVRPPRPPAPMGTPTKALLTLPAVVLDAATLPFQAILLIFVSPPG